VGLSGFIDADSAKAQEDLFAETSLP